MIIDKEIVSKVNQDYFFISGIFDIDAEYFKKRIDEGVKSSTINFKTNVVGKHTEWEFFNKDKNFGILLLQMIDYIEELTMKKKIDIEKFYLAEAWGLIETLGGYTKKHNHGSCSMAGVLYLNDHPQKLRFPEIHQEVTPKTGRFIIFSSFLKHYTKRNLHQEEKYAISFNFKATSALELHQH